MVWPGANNQLDYTKKKKINKKKKKNFDDIGKC
jgi:hypothetical protein